jgi:hypothetical protein
MRESVRPAQRSSCCCSRLTTGARPKLLGADDIDGGPVGLLPVLAGPSVLFAVLGLRDKVLPGLLGYVAAFLAGDRRQLVDCCLHPRLVTLRLAFCGTHVHFSSRVQYR